MIELPGVLGPDGRPLVVQKLVHPSVYLDTWAIREFAEINPVAGRRFRAALVQAGGTLVMSTLSLVEFAGVSDPRHSEAAAEFIDAMAPNLFFSRFEPFEVGRREHAIIAGLTKESPFGDEALLRLYAEDRLSVKRFFAQLQQHRLQVDQFRDQLAAAVHRAIEDLRTPANSHPGMRRDMRQPLKSADRPRATRALMRIIFAELEADRALPKDPNSALDMFQSIVPAAYCTYVLVDGQWHDRLTRARRRIEAGGLAAKVASSYSKRENGIEQFLRELEGKGLARAL
jgi:hypothetical protein